MLNRTSYDSAATDNIALTWDPAYSTVGGELPFVELPKFQIHGNTPPTTFVRTQLEVTAAGKLNVSFGDIQGLALWLDGKPTPLSSQQTLDLAAGVHTLTLSIDHSLRKQAPLRVELTDGPQVTGKAEWVSGK